ncbi:hypothetical protein HDU97_009534 [Phlyctochytrium planicorne]|nr:hypothetical protein HDU97_009534 [Phlyctochytrium planicorne]
MHLFKLTSFFAALAITATSAAPINDTPTCPVAKASCTAPSLTKISEYASHKFNDNAAVGIAYDPIRRQALVANNADGGRSVDLLDLSNPKKPVLVGTLSGGDIAKGPVASVHILKNLVAVVYEGAKLNETGSVGLFEYQDGTSKPVLVKSFGICSTPRKGAFSPNGRWFVVPCEGLPSEDLTVDPNGGIAVIDVSNGAASASVGINLFRFLENDSIAGMPRLPYSKNTAQSVSPNRLAISDDSNYAFVTMQRNNALAKVNIVASFYGAGGVPERFKLFYFDDIVDRPIDYTSDGKIDIVGGDLRLQGLHMPNDISSYTIPADPCDPSSTTTSYLITANGGVIDSTITTAAKNLPLNPFVFKTPIPYGNLSASTLYGKGFGETNFRTVAFPGTRSFTIWNATDTSENYPQVFDSKNDIEKTVAAAEPLYFNSLPDKARSFDEASTTLGPKPSTVAVGRVNGTPLVFISLENQSAIMVYDVTNITAPKRVSYVNSRKFEFEGERRQGSLKPVDTLFVEAAESANGNALLLVANAVSGSVDVYEVRC